MDLPSVRVLSLCSGGGGLDLGVRLAIPGAREVCFVEHEAFPASVLVARMEEGLLAPCPVWTDLRTFDGRPWRGVVDLVVGGYPCFAAGTLVLTERGYWPIEDVAVGDRVLTHLGRWRRVVSVMSRDDAPLWRLDAQGVPGVVTTPEHPFWSRRQGRWWDNEARRYKRTFSEPSWDRADSLLNARVSQVLPEVQPDDHSTEFWWVIGRWLADGHCVRRKLTGKGNPVVGDQGRAVFSIGRAKADEFARRVAAAGFHAYRSEERTASRFHVTNQSLYHFLAAFGSGASGKRIPGFAVGLDPTRAESLLLGYLSGDGSRMRNPEVWSATTTSKALALGLALVAQRAWGRVASIRKHTPPPHCIIEGRTVNQRPFYKLSIPDSNRAAFVDGAYGWKQVRKSAPAGRGRVWNIAVEEDESYCADGAVVHNCQPFSVAGRRRGEDDPRHLWPQVARIVSEVEPPFVFFENVPGHIALGLREVLADLSRLGYRVEDRKGLPSVGIFSAEEVGAPHQRKRLFILAAREDALLAGARLPVVPHPQRGPAE